MFNPYLPLAGAASPCTHTTVRRGTLSQRVDLYALAAAHSAPSSAAGYALAGAVLVLAGAADLDAAAGALDAVSYRVSLWPSDAAAMLASLGAMGGAL